MRRVSSVMAAVLAACFISSAHATTINFSSFVAPNSQQAFFALQTEVFGAIIQIDTNPYSSVSPAGEFNFFPELFVVDGRGLGVCSIPLSSTICANLADRQDLGLYDPVFDPLDFRDDDRPFDSGEDIEFTFFEAGIGIDAFSFVDPSGNSLNDSDTVVRLFASDFTGAGLFGGSAGVFTLAELNDFAAAGGLNNLLSLSIFGVTRPLYVESMTFNNGVTEVPAPAALPLFIAGLAGLGFLRRRSRSLTTARN